MNIVKAWKDPSYRASLTAEERAQLPDNPAGATPLDIDQLTDTNGGTVIPTGFLVCGRTRAGDLELCMSPTYLPCA